MPAVPISHPTLTEAKITLTRTSTAPPLFHATLSDARTLNALSATTFAALNHILTLTEAETPSTLLLTSSTRFFSSGGNIAQLRSKALTVGAPDTSERRAAGGAILRIEYDFIARLAALRPDKVLTVALADGAAFGAGAGLFSACAVRLVTRHAALAMPEARVGLVPDCAMSGVYARLPGAVGIFAALTGYRFASDDIVTLGMAHGLVDGASGVLEVLEGRGTGGVGEVLERVGEAGMAVVAKPGGVCDEKGVMRRGIDACFLHGGLEEVVAAVEARAGEEAWAQKAVEAIRAGAPIALRRVFLMMREAYREGGGISEAIEREFRENEVLVAAWEFEEGVRALLVDKDHKPRWTAAGQDS